MTEEQAKEKVCPIMQPNMGDGYCLGTKCMAWRWYTDEDQDRYEFEDLSWPLEGYCGLGGKP